MVSDAGRNLVLDVWTAFAESALFELSPCFDDKSCDVCSYVQRRFQTKSPVVAREGRPCAGVGRPANDFHVI